ncbi:aminoglycoside phosphotransferase family protein [Streptomyces sp. WAC05374]|uniref:phosphotransferase family protein n=1 Tax=Streptomyces sp. WAC05374 TaxID=2487420 RepID=UPI000F8616DC|nr:aminoglycoside phosphotransferase family protein [Streptomyces sp. WAC05374]RST12898.1 aminoglycoside phosphotransferase family protein [Streptomyces sp. WAC05374]TDF42612.1 aminoglycoside phosphotransferase family protein [Streptomyces sp. WAC05374]TDF51172.1 aminoglycoside phosphotransferase family protein [Streptomyces sp. WAC05374]TDF52485.1 aminoglycoside phosphotransferase family protein [Streptomyces sp. WAC05374]
MTGVTTGAERAARAAETAAVAAEVFRHHGADFAAARRAAGWTNATWLGGGLAVRVAGSAGAQDLVRETRLAALLPPEVGYPQVLDSGATRGFEWVVTREIAATSLDDAWNTLDGERRAAAARQLWERARAVHRVDPAAAAAVARPHNPFYARSPDEAGAALLRLHTAGVLTRDERARLSAALDRHWAALPDAPRVLNHGDLSPVNALWDGTDVVALLDFEFAVLAPVQLDLNELVKLAFAPPPAGAGPTARERAARALLQEAVAELARPLLRTDADADLLIGHSIQLETWGLERELAKPGSKDHEDWEPYRMLVACAHTDGGHYAPLLGR